MKHSEEWYSDKAVELAAKSHQMATVTAIPGGVRADLSNYNVFISFWYKRHVYAFSYSPAKTQRFTPGMEYDIIRDEMIRLEKPKFTAPAISVEGDKGTQACIDHCKRKLELLKKTAPADHKGGVMLQILIDEFVQYL